MPIEQHDPMQQPPDYQGPAPAFPLALIAGGLVLIVGIIILVFIWVAADDEPKLNRASAPTAALVELRNLEA